MTQQEAQDMLDKIEELLAHIYSYDDALFAVCLDKVKILEGIQSALLEMVDG